MKKRNVFPHHHRWLMQNYLGNLRENEKQFSTPPQVADMELF